LGWCPQNHGLKSCPCWLMPLWCRCIPEAAHSYLVHTFLHYKSLYVMMDMMNDLNSWSGQNTRAALWGVLLSMVIIWLTLSRLFTSFA
jgi:hypothetical protein